MRIVFGAFVALLLFSGALGAAEVAAAEQRPNIVLILADDLGWMDLASYAARVRGVERSECFYETPNLDRFADQGMSFSQAYSCALCSPARASILTGQYAARHGFLTASGNTNGSYYSRKMAPKQGYHIHARKENEAEKSNPALGYITPSFTYALQSGQPDDERDAVTIAEALKGYRSAMLGKWHLGALGVEGYQPRDQGFEELAYFDHGGAPYRVIAPMAGGGVAVVAYNLTDPERPVEGTLTAEDYRHAGQMAQPCYGKWRVPEDGLIVYHWYEGRAERLLGEVGFQLPGFGDRLFILTPIVRGWSIIGRPDKYLSPEAVDIIEIDEGEAVVRMKEAGPLLVWRHWGEVSCNLAETRTVGGGLWRVELPVGRRGAVVRLRG